MAEQACERPDSGLGGIWPPILIETTANGRLNLDAVSVAVSHFAAAGVHGVYTADSASEFYALEYDEWNKLATHFRAQAAAVGLSAGVGCTWTNQAGALRRVARARELGFDNIHLSPPYWLPLNREAEETFWRAVDKTASDLPIIVYAGSRGQFNLNGRLLQRIRSFCPAVCGTKSLGFDAVATNSLLTECADMAHFVHEQVYALWAGLGAVGCFSNLAGLCPAIILDLHRAVCCGAWQRAFELQWRINAFYQYGAVPVREAGFMLDKAMATLGAVPGATREMRPPYRAVPNELFEGLQRAARRYLPECFGGQR